MTDFAQGAEPDVASASAGPRGPSGRQDSGAGLDEVPQVDVGPPVADLSAMREHLRAVHQANPVDPGNLIAWGQLEFALRNAGTASAPEPFTGHWLFQEATRISPDLHGPYLAYATAIETAEGGSAPQSQVIGILTEALQKCNKTRLILEALVAAKERAGHGEGSTDDPLSLASLRLQVEEKRARFHAREAHDLARKARAEGDLLRATQVLRAAIVHRPRDDVLLKELASIEVERGNAGSILHAVAGTGHELYQRAVQLAPRRSHVYAEYMQLLFDTQGTLGEATDPWSARSVFRRGYEACRDEPEHVGFMLRAWTKLARDDAQGPDVDYSRAWAFARLNDLKQLQPGTKAAAAVHAFKSSERRDIDASDARRGIAAAVEDAPFDARMYHQAAEIEFKTGNVGNERESPRIGTALFLLEWATLLDPAMPHAWQTIARIRALQGLGTMRPANPPPNAEWTLEQLVEGTASARYAAWRSVAARRGYSLVPSLVSWSTLEARQGDARAALKLRQRAIHHARRDGMDRPQLARIYCDLGWIAAGLLNGARQGVGYYALARFNDPTSSYALGGLAKTLSRLGQAKAAHHWALEWVRLDPSSVEARKIADQRALEYFSDLLTRDSASAEEYVQSNIPALFFQASKATGWELLGRSCMQRKAWEDARDFAYRGLSEDNGAVGPRALLAAALIELGHLEEASRIVVELDALDPHQSVRLNSVIEQFMTRAARARPRSSVAKVMEVQVRRGANSWQVGRELYGLAMAARGDGDWPDFWDCIDATLRVAPRNSFALAWNARRLIQDGRPRDGVREFERALEAMPTNNQQSVIMDALIDCAQQARRAGRRWLLDEAITAMLLLEPRNWIAVQWRDALGR